MGGLLAGFDELLVDGTIAFGCLAEALSEVIDLTRVVVVAMMVLLGWLGSTQPNISRKTLAKLAECVRDRITPQISRMGP